VQDQESTKVAGLDAGADDFLTKPYGGDELLARLRAMLRRNTPAATASAYRFGDIEIDLARRRVTRAGHALKLTRIEYGMLRLFVSHPDKVLTHRHVLRELWGPRFESQTHYVRTYMLRLRRKLGEDVNEPKYFQTEAGVGYRFVAELEEVASSAVID
jgi:two-component system KDP operon response regulator KdpE